MSTLEQEKIDLLYIFVRFVRFVKRAKKHIIISIIVGTALGFVYFSIKPPIYKSQLTAYSSNLNSEQVSDVMSDLAQLITDKDFVQLEQKTGMANEIVSQIVSIECKPNITLESLKKDNNNDGTFNITVSVRDIKILDTLEIGLMYYLESNPYIQKRVKLKLEGIEQDMIRIKKEMGDLEVLKIDMLGLITNNQNKSNLFLSDAGNISSQLIELFQKYSTLAYDKEFAGTDIRVIKSFTKSKKRASPNLALSLAGSIIICLLIGLSVFFAKPFILILKEIN